VKEIEVMSASAPEGGGGGGGGDATTAMGYFWKAREYVTPTLKKTAFLTRGVLTPEEFVRAGDELVYRCPTWSWASSSDDSKKRKSYLPPDRQYLITRNVPCRDRVATLERNMDLRSENYFDGDDDDTGGGGAGTEDDWMVSSMPKERAQQQEASIEDEFDVLDEDGEVLCQPRKDDVAVEQEAVQDADAEGDEYADMADFEDDNVLDDDDAVVKPAAAATSDNNNDNNNDHLVKVRTYDLSITYDKYYQTPRIWMSGRSETTGSPLTAAETMEDVMTDYANRTVTMEAHPFLAGPHASIHPCQHGKVMKLIVQNLMAATSSTTTDVDGTGGGGPAVEMYIFILLKFVSSIIPTINYDFTMDVTADTSKK
jgi:ubiquitin-like-conjugating enzyme ATG3